MVNKAAVFFNCESRDRAESLSTQLKAFGWETALDGPEVLVEIVPNQLGELGQSVAEINRRGERV